MIPALLAFVLASPPASASPIDYDAAAKEVRAILTELITADTTNPPGNESRAAAIGARYLKEAGIPFELSEFAPGRQNLVARLKSSGSDKPLLLMAHTDVVGTAGQTWASEPHKLIETGGYLAGRGSSDDLGMAAVTLETLLLLKHAGVPLRRDVVLVWEGDEESGGAGVQFLLKNKRASIDGGLAFNEGAAVMLDDSGKVSQVNYQVAEKLYQDFELVARGPTGHSSVPLEGNAIYRLSAALERLGQRKRPARLLPVTRAYLAARAAVEPPELASALRKIAESKGDFPAEALQAVEANPSLSAFLRTTCVATMLQGGTRVNALPAEAKANVNCRILPDENRAQIQAWLAEAVGDAGIEVRAVEPFSEPGGASALEGQGPAAIRKVAGQLWPGAPVIPVMEKGATDSNFLRAAGIPSYGIYPLPMKEADRRRAHGADERVPAASLRPGVEFFHRLVLELAGPA